MQHDSPLRIACEDLIIFQKTLQDKGIRTAILTWREEWAPASDVPGENHGNVVFGSLREVNVLGYHKPSGTIISLALHGAAAEKKTIREQLIAAGFTVEERCRNLT